MATKYNSHPTDPCNWCWNGPTVATLQLADDEAVGHLHDRKVRLCHWCWIAAVNGLKLAMEVRTRPGLRDPDAPPQADDLDEVPDEWGNEGWTGPPPIPIDAPSDT